MRLTFIIFFCFFIEDSYGSDHLKIISFNEVTFEVPVNWFITKSKDCLSISKEYRNTTTYIKVCESISRTGSDFFTVNNEGRWEAASEGIPVLADINVTPEFVGMSAIVSCRINDDSGYHVDQCFQAEIALPENHFIIFTGTGNSTLFMIYKNIYASLKVKEHVLRR
ncbi:hypothetical protein [Escherichia marmotae]|uniref:hypothetical protein n=1 Tax=Escherichia marmotae TaxID=1499973 RepID=UPI001C9DB409|nr:hypothetical protein [Escherichia marmotae]